MCQSDRTEHPSPACAQAAALELVHVPSRGAAPGVLDVAAGRADTIITNLGDVVAQLGEGLRLRWVAPEHLPFLQWHREHIFRG